VRAAQVRAAQVRAGAEFLTLRLRLYFCLRIKAVSE